MNIIDNYFQQKPVTYSLQLQVKFQNLEPFVKFGETLSDSIVYFEAEDTKTIDSKPEDLWQIDIYLDQAPDLKLLDQEVSKIAHLLNIISPKLKLIEIEDKDWALEVQKTFIPIIAGKFFIHPSKYEQQIPEKLISIEINAGSAFGTGEHETTSNCLEALSEIKQFDIGLDMGCGSGILAMAMAKLGFKKIIAVDLDPQAVLVTAENTQLNKIESVIAEQSDGYNSDLVSKNAPYQVITANILASPLIAMASDAAKHLAKDGILILAGFLKDQKLNVLEAHQKEGLVLVKEICICNWPTLVMRKP
jgi:ribosomal protein L11 methyltransferase